MAALTNDRDTMARDIKITVHPVQAGARLYAGAIACLDTSDGFAVQGKTATGLRGLGRVRVGVDNTAGADGEQTVECWRGCFRWASDGSINRTHIGAAAYAVDDQTVAAGDDAGTRSAIGTIRDIDAQGVWVEI